VSAIVSRSPITEDPQGQNAAHASLSQIHLSKITHPTKMQHPQPKARDTRHPVA
jgi:hypothetical protein